MHLAASAYSMITDKEIAAFDVLLQENAQHVTHLLGMLLTLKAQEAEIMRPNRLLAAMRHGVLAGGKRLRPFLVRYSARLFDADPTIALHVAASLEAVHCYSLIHDDLPAMDDDDLRRGQPTVHKAFDEATAILAGDALLTLAFDILASLVQLPSSPSSERIFELIQLLSRASGCGGMVGGQMLDLMAEHVSPNENGIITLQVMKTGALIRYACEAGAILGGASVDDRARLVGFGSSIGLAFQLADDLLDATSTTTSLGKKAGKDAKAGKATLISLHGEAWVRRQLEGLVAEADRILEPFGESAEPLRRAAHFIIQRQH